jgi:hypothetical protein
MNNNAVLLSFILESTLVEYDITDHDSSGANGEIFSMLVSHISSICI